MRRPLSALLVVFLAVPVLAQFAVEDATLRPAAYTPSSGEFYASDVATSGRWMVAGAPSDFANGAGSGRAFVHERVGTSWVERQTLVPSDPSATAQFGYYVAIDGERLLVAAPGDANDRGAVYVFELQPSGAWLQAAKLVGSAVFSSARFGEALDISGNHAIVGAGKSNGIAQPYYPDRGAVWFFERQANGTWVETGALMNDMATQYDRFGTSVAIDGTTAIVGMPGLWPGLGYAFIYDLDSSGVWRETMPLIGVRDDRPDGFGFAVAINGDRAVVGAPHRVFANQYPAAGELFVYERMPGTTHWSKASGPGELRGKPTEALGANVQLVGDRIASRGEFAGGLQSVPLFDRDADGTWTRVVDCLPVGFVGSTAFGQDLALGEEDLFVIAPLRNRVAQYALRGLMSDLRQVSLSSGGTQELRLFAGNANAGALFVLAGTASGTTPGTPLPGLVDPFALNFDGYTNAFLATGGAGFLTTPFVDQLDANGRHSMQLVFPAGLPASLAGTTLHHAYLVFGAAGQFSFASNATELLAVP